MKNRGTAGFLRALELVPSLKTEGSCLEPVRVERKQVDFDGLVAALGLFLCVV